MTYQHQKQVLDTPKKKKIIYSFIVFYPLWSFTFGTPIPLPSLLDLPPELFEIAEFLSLLITIIGGLTTLGFYILRYATNKIEANNKGQKDRIDKLEDKIDEAIIVHQEVTKEMYKHIREMEVRILVSMEKRDDETRQEAKEKVGQAKALVDIEFKGIEHRLKWLEDNTKRRRSPV